MKRLSNLLLVVVVTCIFLLPFAAASCSPTQEHMLQGAVQNVNERIDEAYVTASHIAFTGKVVDANGTWLDGYLVILYLNGEELGRNVTQLQKFNESEVGVYNGLFKIEADNVYELSAEDHFVLPNGQILTMSNSEGFAGKTATVYKWFGNLPPGTLMRIQVPSKQVTYALYVSPIAFASLDPEIQYGPTQLTEAGDVIPYVYADRGVSSKPAPAVTPTAVPTTVTYSSLPPAAQPGQVTWTYRLTGFFGNRWEVWERYIRGCVPGMSWVAFKEQVLVHNPHLVQDRFVFYPHKTYVLPEIRQ